MWELSLLLLPVAAFSGWFVARRNHVKARHHSANLRSPASYLAKLNHLLLEHKADKAIDTFLRLSDLDKDTIETHLALATLFRRRGEVDRAVRIHQYLLEQTKLTHDQRYHSLYQLGNDYLGAGLFDRAEAVFLELASQRSYREPSLRKLIEIYEQQRDWEQAIRYAQQLAEETHQSMGLSISHYYCELAEKARDEEDFVRMQDEVQQALRINPCNIRANLLSAELAIEQRRYKTALRAYQRMVREHSLFIPAILNSITDCYRYLHSEPEYIDLIKMCLQQVGSTAAVVSLLDKLPALHVDVATHPSLIRQLQMAPSIWGLQALIQFFMQEKPAVNSEHLPVLYEVTQRIVAEHPFYRCSCCGFSTKVMLWWCPSCKSWETVKPLSSLVN